MLLQPPLTPAQAKLKSPLALAYLGDTVWDLLIRERLLLSQCQAHALHKQAILQVNAGAQAQAADRIEPHLSEAEGDILRRGQNAHPRHATPKNQSPRDYSRATGLEALFGYLYLTQQLERMGELFDIAVGIR